MIVPFELSHTAAQSFVILFRKSNIRASLGSTWNVLRQQMCLSRHVGKQTRYIPTFARGLRGRVDKGVDLVMSDYTAYIPTDTKQKTPAP